MTLIAVYNSEGCVGRCDAHCYNATTPDCNCICGGRNHGAGIERATDNTRDLAEDWIDEFGTPEMKEHLRWEVPAHQPQQTPLFL